MEEDVIEDEKGASKLHQLHKVDFMTLLASLQMKFDKFFYVFYPLV